jgi:hypothetical protein
MATGSASGSARIRAGRQEPGASTWCARSVPSPQRRLASTRRQFARSAAGTAVLGGALGIGFLKSALANTRASFAPVPIRGGTPTLRQPGEPPFYHVFGPAAFDPIDAEPSTITNLDAFARTRPQCLIEEVRFAIDSPVEGLGFEPSVPRQGSRRLGEGDCRKIERAVS